MSNTKKGFLRGALILTAAGFLSRIIGFFYRIFLSRTIGAEQIGIYQLASPLYTLCLALCAVGIHSVLSRSISAKFAKGDKKAAFDTLITGLIISLTLSIAAAFLLHRFSGFLGAAILHETRCVPLLKLLSFSLPFSCLHSCISAYYYARKKTGIPSLSQLLEQVVRVGVSFLFYSISLQQGTQPGALLAVSGVLAGELASCLFSLIAINLEFGKYHYAVHTLEKPMTYTREIFLLSLPLTLNHVLVTVLHSTETILIPGKLEASGLTASAALSLYGVLTGMALPMIMFPSAITNSIAVMLLPSVAEDQAIGNWKSISRTIESTIHYCLILGIFSIGVFFCFGDHIGTLLFDSTDTGVFLKILAFICPFLYLNTTLSSILNGLGKTNLSFIENVIGLGIRILFVMILIPQYGILGYLWGLLISELSITCLNLLFLYHLTPFHFDAVCYIIKPARALLVSLGCSLLAENLLSRLSIGVPLLQLFLSLLIMGVIYLLFFPEEWKKYTKKK